MSSTAAASGRSWNRCSSRRGHGADSQAQRFGWTRRLDLDRMSIYGASTDRRVSSASGSRLKAFHVKPGLSESSERGPGPGARQGVESERPAWRRGVGCRPFSPRIAWVLCHRACARDFAPAPDYHCGPSVLGEMPLPAASFPTVHGRDSQSFGKTEVQSFSRVLSGFQEIIFAEHRY